MMNQIHQPSITACPDANARHVLHPPGKHLHFAIQADFNRDIDLRWIYYYGIGYSLYL